MAQPVRGCSQETLLTRVEKPKDARASTPSVAVAKHTGYPTGLLTPASLNEFLDLLVGTLVDLWVGHDGVRRLQMHAFGNCLAHDGSFPEMRVLLVVLEIELLSIWRQHEHRYQGRYIRTGARLGNTEPTPKGCIHFPT